MERRREGRREKDKRGSVKCAGKRSGGGMGRVKLQRGGTHQRGSFVYDPNMGKHSIYDNQRFLITIRLAQKKRRQKKLREKCIGGK